MYFNIYPLRALIYQHLISAHSVTCGQFACMTPIVITVNAFCIAHCTICTISVQNAHFALMRQALSICDIIVQIFVQ